MTIPRQKIKSDFIDRQIKHNRLVQDYMIILEKNRDKLPFKIPEWEILNRGLWHDARKFSPELVDGFVTLGEYWDNKRAGLSNNHINKETLYNCCGRHQYNERHHFKSHIQNKTHPTNLDICEMCCDWTAHCDRDKKEDNTKYFRKVLVKEMDFCRKRQEDFLQILDLLTSFRRK